MEQEKGRQNSSNSLALLGQHKKLYLAAAHRSRTPKTAIRIVEANYAPKLSETGIAAVIGIIGLWRAYVGATNNTDESQIVFEAAHLQKSFGHLSALDVKNAIDFFLEDKLSIDVPSYVAFSPMHINWVINSYLKFKDKVSAEVNAGAERSMLELSVKPKEQERVQSMKDCIIDCYKHSQEGFIIRFFNDTVYDFLRKTKRMKLDAMVSKSKEYAEKKYDEHRKSNKKDDKKNGSDSRPMEFHLYANPAYTMPRSKAIREYAIDYCLLEFFKENKIKDVLDSITEKDILKVW